MTRVPKSRWILLASGYRDKHKLLERPAFPSTGCPDRTSTLRNSLAGKPEHPRGLELPLSGQTTVPCGG